jgi:hypothetical protein
MSCTGIDNEGYYSRSGGRGVWVEGGGSFGALAVVAFDLGACSVAATLTKRSLDGLRSLP